MADDELVDEFEDCDWWYGDEATLSETADVPEVPVTYDEKYSADLELLGSLRSQIHRTMASWYGRLRGYKGGEGGWIYDSKGKVVCHGWLALYYKRRLLIWKAFWGE